MAKTKSDPLLSFGEQPELLHEEQGGPHAEQQKSARCIEQFRAKLPETLTRGLANKLQLIVLVLA